MSDEPDELDIEAEEYEPLAVALHDNGVVIFDTIEFAAEFNCFAAQYQDGALYLLDKETKLWRNVEGDKKLRIAPVK